MRIALAVVLFVLAPLAGAEPFPTRVLITNDNGIDDPKIIALARRFAPHVETWVIAPDQDRSGSGSHLPGVQAGVLNAEPRDLGDNIKAWAVDGLPADCVILALVGIMIDSPPDLVISGINGGANLGHDWMFSGTIGAARVATLGGIPSIAVSGLNDDLPGAVDAATDWVFRLAISDAVRSLEPGDFLTASLPRTVPGEIRGVQVADRGPPDRYPLFAANPEVPGQWRVTGMRESELEPPQPNDRSLHADGWIVVVPMRVDEVKRSALSSFPKDSLPQWTGASD